MAETIEGVLPDGDPAVPEETESLNELLVELGRHIGTLVSCEAQLAASRHMPEVRRLARDLAAASVAALALVTAFAFANVAALRGLDSLMAGWLSALVLAACWLVVGVVLALVLLSSAERVTGWKWRRLFTSGSDEAVRDLERERAEAETAVRDALVRLTPVITIEIASAAVSVAGNMAEDVAEDVIDAAEDMLEGSEDLVESITLGIPGGGLVNQVWDIALFPGRLGLRVATIILKGPTPPGG